MKKAAIFRFAEIAEKASLPQRLEVAVPPAAGCGGGRPGAEHLDPEPGQVDGARDLQRQKGDGRGLQERSDPERRTDRPDRKPERHSGRGKQAGATPAEERVLRDDRGIGAGNHDQQHREREEGQKVDVHHETLACCATSPFTQSLALNE